MCIDHFYPGFTQSNQRHGGVTNGVSLIRLYTGDDGESHFEDGTLELPKLEGTAHRSWSLGATEVSFEESPAGSTLDWHRAPRRLEKKKVDVISVACHPGYAATELQFAAARMERLTWMEHLFALGNRLFAQDAATGSLPMLYAATAPDVHGGDYIGPDAFVELWLSGEG
jgi:hypothetical protein